jgi:hypothetical protein
LFFMSTLPNKDDILNDILVSFIYWIFIIIQCLEICNLVPVCERSSRAQWYSMALINLLFQTQPNVLFFYHFSFYVLCIR